MAGFLIAREGPLTGLVIRLEDEEQWILGRDPDLSFFPIEDASVSRRHIMITLKDDGFWLQNLSEVNPAQVNGTPLDEDKLLHEGDMLQMGSSLFEFTEKEPASDPEAEEEEKEPTIFEPAKAGLDTLSFTSAAPCRYMIKVINGPNSGAEFPLVEGATYLIGKDPTLCDIIFNDVSVSKQHARISATEDGAVTIDDLSSKNGVMVAGKMITAAQPLVSQDIVTLGTTSFVLIDQRAALDTIYTPAKPPPGVKAEEEETEEEAPKEKSWKDMIIPTRHLLIAGAALVLLIFGVGSMLSLFNAKQVAVESIDEDAEIKKIVHEFPGVEYTYDEKMGTIFILGHVLTEVGHEELTYLLRTLPFIHTIENSVVTDEIVTNDMNALLATNPNWRGITMIARKPGQYILRGYLETVEERQELMEYVNRNFSFLDRLENQVIVERNLQTQIQAMLTEKNFANVTLQLSAGEVILSGRLNEKQEKSLKETVMELKKLPGVRSVKNFVVITTASTLRVDLTSRYTVTGVSKYGKLNQFVVINGRILSKGESLDGMMITAIGANEVLLEKDGIKYRIQYNLQ